MFNAQPISSWHQLDDEEQDDAIWSELLEVDSGQNERNAQQKPMRNTLTEILVLLLLILAIAGTVLWQRGENRIASLEKTVLELQSSMAEAKQSPNLAVTPEIDSAKISTGDPLSVIETEYFSFRFHEQDAAAITDVAAKSDSQYLQLRQDLGMGVPFRNEKLHVSVTKDKHVTYAMSEPAGNEFELALISPSQLAAQGIENPVEKLSRDLYHLLRRRSLNNRLHGKAILPQWEAFVENLHLYFWKEQILEPNWQQLPHYLKRRQVARLYSLSVVNQTEYAPPNEANGWTSPERGMSYLIADPLVEFMMVEYGLSYLPKLLTAFGQHETWESLAPEVFDVSESEFEAQWHAYLAAHYPRD